MTRREFLDTEMFTSRREALATSFLTAPPALPAPLGKTIECDTVVEMHDVTIRYGSHTILNGINWTIRKGEKWSLQGPNGAGKSTLLSLVSADNPQAYAQDIVLFGRRRGSGESIWDIKKNIGYVSPEMHRAYVADIPAVDIVASGFFDTIGLYRHPDDAQRAVCMEWMRAFGIDALRNRSFVKLSSGEQRLVLLTRTFVKDPALLILDEPLHGLDCCNKELARGIIEAFCSRADKTMIYVTHYPQELPRCIDRFMTLSRN